MVREQSSHDKRLFAYVAGQAPALNDTIIRDFLKSKLPYFMLPSDVIVLDKLPLNANGKVDRRALLEYMAVPQGKAKLPPRNALETQLVSIWEKALGIEPIGVTDDFFELGGHSLMAARIFSKIKTMLGKDLPLATLFQTPTVEKLAVILQERGWKPTWSPLVAIQPRGSRPAFFAVHGGDGEVMFYSELVRCLGNHQPFLAFRLKAWKVVDRVAHRSKQSRVITFRRFVESKRTVRISWAAYVPGALLHWRWLNNSAQPARR
jgi:acyl carrier protein